MTDLHSDESAPEGSEEGSGTPPVPARYGFGAFVRAGWQVFRRDTQRLIGIFCVLHVVAALIPFVFFFEVSNEAALPLIFLTRVVIPVVVGSIAVAIGGRILGRADDAAATAPTPDAIAGDQELPGPARTRALDLFALSLIAAMFSIAGVLFLRAYGFLILHMFYGPPVAMQVAVLEGRSFNEATRRARALLRGNWRLILYLLNLAVLVGILNLVLLGPLYGLLDGSDFELAPALAVSVVHGIILGVLTSYLAASQVALYEHLRGLPAGAPASSGTGMEPPAGIDGTESAP